MNNLFNLSVAFLLVATPIALNSADEMDNPPTDQSILKSHDGYAVDDESMINKDFDSAGNADRLLAQLDFTQDVGGLTIVIPGS